jgi:RNA polymerase sigma-70 factor (ECF subfamily)
VDSFAPFVDEVMGTVRRVSDEPVDLDARRADFAALYRAHVSEVFRYVHRRCGDRAVAEDVTQDVFLTAVRTAGDPHSVSIGWLIRVARNRLIDVMRRQARLSDKLGVIHDRAVGLDIHLDAAVVDRLIVVEALRRLSIDHRIVLTLHYLDGYSAPALAEELGRSVRSVEGLLFRAREGLRRELVSNDA